MRFLLFLTLLMPLASRIASGQDRKSEEKKIGACAIGGGMAVSARASATYALSVEHDSLYIGGIAIGRAQPGWRGSGGSRKPLQWPVRPGVSGMLPGATIDTLFFQFDLDAKIAWVHMQKVPLDTNNVVLVDRVDSHGGPPVVAGLYRIPSPIPFRATCADKAFNDNLFAAIEKALRANRAIAAFIGADTRR